MKLNSHSFSKAIITTLVLCLFSPTIYARSTTLTEPAPVTLNCDLSEKKMQIGIRNGGAMRGWVIVNQTAGNTELNYVKGDKYSITVDVNYTANTFAVKYKDSMNLDYKEKKGVRYLHPNAVKWMINLSGDIRLNTNDQCFPE